MLGSALPARKGIHNLCDEVSKWRHRTPIILLLAFVKAGVTSVPNMRDQESVMALHVAVQ
jgi:hypothetical protein